MSEVDWFRRFPAGGTRHRHDQRATPQATVAFSTDRMNHHNERKGRDADHRVRRMPRQGRGARAGLLQASWLHVRKLSSALGRAGLWLAAAGVALVLGLLVLEWVARLVVLY